MFSLLLFFIVCPIQLTASDPPPDIESGLMYVFSNDFAYTLIGSKPVSVEQSLNDELDENIDKKDQLFSFLENTLGRSKAFIFKVIDKYGQIELIHKKALKKQIRTSSTLLKFITTKYGSVGAFFKALANPLVSVFDIVDGDPVLLAIVLGYGEENGRFFIRRIELGEHLQKYPIVAFFPFDQKPGPWYAFAYPFFRSEDLYRTCRLKVVPHFESLEQEWNEIEKASKWREAAPVPPYYLALPVYIAKNGPKSKELAKKFIKARYKLANLFYKKKFSKAIAEAASIR